MPTVPTGDPWTSAAASFAGSFGKGLSDAIGGGSGPFIGGSSSAAAYGTTQDGSGWIVNVGGQQTATASPVRTSTASPTIGAGDEAGFLRPQQAGVGGVAGVLLGLVFLGLLLRKRGT